MEEMMTTKHENIHQAMAAIMEEVGYVKKQRSPNLNYSYAGEAALIEALRPAMVEHGVFVHVLRYFNVTQTGYTTAKGTDMTRTVMQAVIRFAHESGTFIDVESAGEGADSGDKSVNKAMTGAYKYALRQTFCIETGDDPDKYPSEPKQAAGKPQTKPKEQPANNGHSEANAGLMPLDEAEAVTNSEGVRYGDIETETLANMANSIAKASKKSNLSDAKAAEYDLKSQAIRAILASRNGK